MYSGIDDFQSLRSFSFTNPWPSIKLFECERAELKSPLHLKIANVYEKKESNCKPRKKRKYVLSRMNKFVDSSKINATMLHHLIYIYHKLVRQCVKLM